MKKPFLIGFAACAIVLTLCAAIVQNTFTTVTPGQFPTLLPSPSANSNWFVVVHTDGDGAIYESAKFAGINTNLNWNGRFGADSGSFTNALLFNGIQVSTNSSGGSESAPVNNWYSTNNFFISGKGNSLVITQTLTVSGRYVYPLEAGTGITFVTNNVGTGQTNLTISTSGGGSGVSTQVTPLTYSTTNAVGFDCTTNNMSYTLLLTNHVLFGTSTFVGLPNTTTNMFFTLGLQQNSAGGWVPKFTNSICKWASGNQPVIDTNANAVSYVYFHSSLFTNGTLVGSVNQPIQ